MSTETQRSLHLPLLGDDQQHLALLASPEELGLSPRAVHATAAARVRLVGQLVQLSAHDLFRIPNVGRKTVHEVRNALACHGLQLGMRLAGWDTNAALEERHRLGPAIRRHLASVTSKPARDSEFLEDELHLILESVATDRNLLLLSSLWGFDGSHPKTLDAVGRRFNLTRERVRQLAAKARQQFERSWHEAPILEKALSLIENSVPATNADLSQMLLRESFTSGQFDTDSVLIAADLLGRPGKVVGHRIGDVTLYELSERARWLHRLPIEFRKATQANGCANVERLTLGLGGRLEQAFAVRRILDALPETRWLDEGRSWAMSSLPTRNRLSNLIAKILTVAKAVQISELRSAASRFHRMSYTPPRGVIAEFCRQTKVAVLIDDFVTRSENFQPLELGWVEQILVDAFRQLGSPLERDQLEEFCIDQRGMNINTFGVLLSYSPLVQRLATAIYSLIGATCQIGTIEDIQARRTQNPPAASSYGWTSGGNLWCALRLDRLTIKTGKRTLPVFVAGMTQGKWAGIFEDGISIGDVLILEQGVSGLASALSMGGAENEDVARLSFSLVERRVSIEVGGDEFFEAPDTQVEQPDDFDEELDSGS